MNKIFVKPIDISGLDKGQIIEVLDEKCENIPIDVINWPEYPNKPEVSLKIAYTMNQLIIKYFVKNEYVRAVEKKNNGKVWEDSCCEFFCSFNSNSYYNFETNCIGTQLLGYREIGEDTTHASELLIDKIYRFSSLGSEPIEIAKAESYELLVIIPESAFFLDNIKLQKGLRFKANFYKCGDETPNPHFLSWNKIVSDKPNFHLPEYFGAIELL